MLIWKVYRVCGAVAVIVGVLVPMFFPEGKNLVGIAIPGIFFFLGSFAGDGDKAKDEVLITITAVLWTLILTFAMSWSGIWVAIASEVNGWSLGTFVACVLLSMFLMTKVKVEKWKRLW